MKSHTNHTRPSATARHRAELGLSGPSSSPEISPDCVTTQRSARTASNPAWQHGFRPYGTEPAQECLRANRTRFTHAQKSKPHTEA